MRCSYSMSNILRIGLSAALLAGCAHVDITDPQTAVTGRPNLPKPHGLDGWVDAANTDGWLGLANENREKLQVLAYAAREAPYYRRAAAPADRPNRCLALSGGGLRAATFAVGVLEGLDSEPVNLLQEMDIASAVSGGAWALSWFYAQQALALGQQGSPLDATAEMRIKARQRLFTEAVAELKEKSHFMTAGEGVLQGVADILFIPVNLVANGIFDNQFNTSPGHYYYEERLARTYHSSAASDIASNTLTLGLVGNMVMANNTLATTNQSVKRMPFPIINAAIQVDDDVAHHGSSLANTVFEITPSWIGNDWFGYLYNSPGADGLGSFTDAGIPDLTRAVSISGAAVDSGGIRNMSPALQVWWNVLNTGLSYNIPNYNPAPKFQTSLDLHHLVPWPLYLLSHHTRNPDGVRLRLGDGGFAENLGMYSLVRRMCQEIYVIDAEHDPDYVFNAYHSLKAALKAEMNVDFSISDIDVNPPAHIALVGPDSAAGRFRPMAQGEKKACTLLKNQVMNGEINYLPLTGEKLEKSTITVHLIKLSMPSDTALNVPNSVKRFMERRNVACAKKGMTVPEFPQEKTENLDYSPETFQALYDLGRWIVQANSSKLLAEKPQ